MEQDYDAYLKKIFANKNIDLKMLEDMLKKINIQEFEEDVYTILGSGGSMEDVEAYIDTVVQGLKKDCATKPIDNESRAETAIDNRRYMEMESKPAIQQNQITDLRIILETSNTVDELLAKM